MRDESDSQRKNHSCRCSAEQLPLAAGANPGAPGNAYTASSIRVMALLCCLALSGCATLFPLGRSPLTGRLYDPQTFKEYVAKNGLPCSCQQLNGDFCEDTNAQIKEQCLGPNYQWTDLFSAIVLPPYPHF
jgi:hypothetical protein